LEAFSDFRVKLGGRRAAVVEDDDFVGDVGLAGFEVVEEEEDVLLKEGIAVTGEKCDAELGVILGKDCTIE